MPIRKMTISVSLLATAVLVSNVLFAAPPAKDVNVVNQPTVTVDDTTPIKVDVQGGAIFALDVDQPARQRFAKTVALLIIPTGSSDTDSSLIVPADKILVIEHVSIQSRPAFPTPAGAFIQLTISTDTVGLTVSHPIGLVEGVDSGVLQVGGIPAGATFVLSQPVRLYADPGSVVQVGVIRNFNNTTNSFNQSMFVTISGHFVDP